MQRSCSISEAAVTETDMQSLRYAEVPTSFQPYIASVFFGTAEPGPTPMPALPGQIWLCSFPAYWIPPGETQARRLPAVGVTGPTLRSHTFVAEQGGSICGIGFRPLGWVKLVRIPASELVHKILDA